MSLLYTLSTRFLTVPMQQQIHITETTHAVVNAPFLLKESLQIKHETPQKKCFQRMSRNKIANFSELPLLVLLENLQRYLRLLHFQVQ